MADPARRSADSPAAPGWGDVRQAMMAAAEICACAAVTVAVRGPHGAHAAVMLREAADALRDFGPQLRGLAFDEAVIEAEASRRADEIMAAAGVAVPAQHRRRLRAVR